MSWDVVHKSDLEWEERPGHEGQEPRHAATLTEAAQMTESRARMWRYPAHTRGRRHLDPDQEEVFVPLHGTLTMLLGDPPERVDLPPRSVVAVEPGTGIQMRNESDAEVVVFVYGAPPVVAQARYLDDVEL